MDYKRPSSYFHMPLICVVLISFILYGGVSKDHASSVFGNMTYHIEGALNENQKNVKLVNGFHQEREFLVEYERRFVYDDFNHDGLKDAAVILLENTGGNQDWYTLAFLINDGKRLVHRSSIYLDDDAMIYAMKAENGKVYLDMNVHQEGDCHAGPTEHVRESYLYPGSNIFTNRLDTYIFGENAKGVKGIPF